MLWPPVLISSTLFLRSNVLSVILVFGRQEAQTTQNSLMGTKHVILGLDSPTNEQEFKSQLLLQIKIFEAQ